MFEDRHERGYGCRRRKRACSDTFHVRIMRIMTSSGIPHDYLLSTCTGVHTGHHPVIPTNLPRCAGPSNASWSAPPCRLYRSAGPALAAHSPHAMTLLRTRSRSCYRLSDHCGVEERPMAVTTASKDPLLFGPSCSQPYGNAAGPMASPEACPVRLPTTSRGSHKTSDLQTDDRPTCRT